MFKKFNVDLSDLDLARLKGNATTQFGKTFIETALNDRQYLLDYLANKIIFGIPPDRMLITEILSPGARPHCDTWKTALNYYFDAGSDITYFFKEKSDAVVGWAHHGLRLYNIETLDVVDTFVADKNDCYLLNVHEIHCIKMPEPNKTRTMLRFTWNEHDFDTVANSITIL